MSKKKTRHGKKAKRPAHQNPRNSPAVSEQKKQTPPAKAVESKATTAAEPRPEPAVLRSEPAKPKEAAKPRKSRRLFDGIVKTLAWGTVLTFCWWLLSAMVPGIPAPVRAAKALLFFVKDMSDSVYFTAKREDLEESARMVRESAEEIAPPPIQGKEKDTMSAERKKKLPAISVEDDSALRATMKAISAKPMVAGRVINVVLIGIDSRLGVRDARADAIHLFTVNPDSGIVEIMSVPRDTYCDLGYPDTTSFNIMSNARALGYQGFMNRVGELTGRGKVKYYVEVGFSQAMGVLEMLGYKDPVKTLKFLRTRKALAAGDIQRSHNQAVFLRENLIGKFSLLSGATGELFLSAGLNFVSTNLSKDFCQGVIYSLQQTGFPNHRPDAVRLRMLPRYKIRLKEMRADSLTIAKTLKRVEDLPTEDYVTASKITARLRNINRLALADSSRPGQVIHRLERIAEQHAWMQIRDADARYGIRDTLLSTLERAYRKVGKNEQAEAVVRKRQAEDLLIQR